MLSGGLEKWQLNKYCQWWIGTCHKIGCQEFRIGGRLSKKRRVDKRKKNLTRNRSKRKMGQVYAFEKGVSQGAVQQPAEDERTRRDQNKNKLKYQ